MRNIVFLISFFLLSCNENKTDETTEPSSITDSVLIKSQSNLIQSDSIQKKSDSTTKEQVIKVIREFKYLTNEVEKFKTERIQLMNVQNMVTEKIIYRIDTVYIETKKNFWGKEKTSTSIKSDSTTTTNTDSSTTTTEKIDTIQSKKY